MSESATDDAPFGDVPPVEVLGGCLYGVERALDYLDAGTLSLKGIEDFDTALGLLADAEKLRARLVAAVGVIHDRAWALRGEAWGEYHHPALGVVSVRRTASKPRWDHAGIARRVVDQHMAEVGGEVTDPATVAAWVLEAGAVSYWRKGVLKELGIDVSGEDLLTTERGNPKIEFPSQQP